jgi:hypothetical protein
MRGDSIGTCEEIGREMDISDSETRGIEKMAAQLVSFLTLGSEDSSLLWIL